LEKYERFSKNIEVNTDESKVWCPYPDCNVPVDLSKDVTNIECSNGHKF
jgi:hypothetical protein